MDFTLTRVTMALDHVCAQFLKHQRCSDHHVVRQQQSLVQVMKK